LALSSYSGFTINGIGFYFTDYLIHGYLNSIKPQIIFFDLPVESSNFITLCDYFVSEGDEKFITIGRVTPLDKTEVIQRTNVPVSSFGLKNSAYYLIDEVELFPIDNQKECDCSGKSNEITSIRADTTQIQISELEIEKLKSGKSIILKNVNFEFNSFNLQWGSDLILKELKNFLIEKPEVRIEITGHTDDVGNDAYNLTLSVNRAKSVYLWLINNGIAMERLTYKGLGKNQPLYQTPDEKLKALNRRVEVKIQENR
jgi:outer membrane protein OmpA-like peptidoglycan-associated protein